MSDLPMEPLAGHNFHDIVYDYSDVPTCQAFASSNAFMRGLMGPYGCTSGDTEFLTPAGWRRIDEYAGELVAQWDQATGEISFVEPEAYVVLPCDELIEFDSGSLVMRLSAEHRVPHLNWNKKFQVKTAAEIEKHPSLRTIPTTFAGPRLIGLGMSDDLIRFAVMMHADGHYPKFGRRAVVGLRKERKKARLRALLSRLGVTWTEHTPARRPTETNFRFEPPYVGKRFTDFWWRASADDLAVVFEEMRHWDGHDGEVLLYATANKEDADFIQYAAHACGRRATIAAVEPRKSAWATHYRVAIRVSDNPKNRAMVRAETKIARIPALGGKKYCFAVPTGFFLARCDDTVFITGNSGKSSVCVTEITNRAQRQRRGPDGIRHSRWAVIRNTFPMLRDTTIRTVFQWLPPQHFGRYVEARHSYQIKAIEGCDIELLFLALDRPDDIKKLLSLELTGGWVNEAREVPWSLIDAAQGRVGRYPAKKDGGPSWFGLWADSNPPDSDSKWFRYFEDKIWLKDFQRMQRAGELPADMRPEQFAAIFKQPSGRGPDAENLTNLPGGRRYYSTLSAGKAPEWVKVYCDGEYGFVVEGKLVYPEYSDQIHCKAVDPIEGVEILRSWDFGLCYSDDTEVLTDHGWKLFKDVDEKTDRAASRDPATGRMEWAPIAFKIAKPFKGDLLQWASTELNMLVTPEHRVPFTYRDSPGVVHWESAEWLAQHMSGHHYVDLTSSSWIGTPINGSDEDDAFAAFMGLYLSEGSVHLPKGAVRIYQRQRDPMMQGILDRTARRWAWNGNGKGAGWSLTDHGLAAYLKQFGVAAQKFVPETLKNLPRSALMAFIDAYTRGDGHIRTRANGTVEHTIFTTSERMAGDLQEIAQKVGWNSSCRRVKPQTSVLDGRTITNTGGYSVTFKKRASRAELHARSFSRVAYDGMVYCLNVPHHTLYVRRNGKPHWNGNTPACIFSQLLPDGRWLVFDEMTSDNMSVDQFGDEVIEHCTKAFRGRATFRDVGDPAGDIRAETDKRTAFDILRAKDIDIVAAVTQDPTLRQESVRLPLRRLTNGEPQFILHPRCRVLRKGFMGGYHRRRMQTAGPERYSEKPEKNSYSHPHDALQYGAAEHFASALISKPRDPDEDFFRRDDDYASDPTRSTVTGY